MSGRYEMVIGLEVHVELATKTKIFCGCENGFGGEPNTRTCPVCAGMPGSLPVLNKKAVEYAMAAGLAMGCQIEKDCMFDRKNYFYPDNPQNYQISQLYRPICRDGKIEIVTKAGGRKAVEIHEIHLEEDAGKLIHDASGVSIVDYNRSGVPLIEIVSEPDMRSAEEAVAYLDELRLLIQYLGISDCKMQEGSMRADVNLSLRVAGTDTLGTRTEMKNLNSFKAVVRAIGQESKRQADLLDAGKQITQETRRWDDGAGRSYPARSKEDARDYRYFPEPDLMPLHIDDAWIKEIRARQPEFRGERRERFQREYALPFYDADVLTGSRKLSDLFEDVAKLCGNPKKASNWIMGETMRLLHEKNMDPEQISFSPVHLAKLITLIDAGTVGGASAKEVFRAIFEKDADPEKYIEENGLKAVDDEDALRSEIKRIVVLNPKSAADYQNGKERALGFLVGQTMKAMKGKADPAAVNRILKEILAG